ncbi:MAG: hypothetical protein BWY67_02351 [Bacteroidetes bacterium ADurb.Bin397]|nr:MAG: hypothetical protein BWY67_02351 [Bacteroidetes bacterium ADurb.Bin397]
MEILLLVDNLQMELLLQLMFLHFHIHQPVFNSGQRSIQILQQLSMSSFIQWHLIRQVTYTLQEQIFFINWFIGLMQMAQWHGESPGVRR